MTPDELAAAALAGDRRAMEQLARFLYGGLRSYFRSRWPHDVADDLVQRTFETMLTKKHRFEPEGTNSFVRWVYGVANYRNQSMYSERAHDAMVMAEFGKVDRTPARGLSSFILLMETAGMLDEQVEQLRPAQRQMVEKFLDKARGEDRSPNHPNFYRLRKQLGRGMAERMTRPVSPPEPAEPAAPPPVRTPPTT